MRARKLVDAIGPVSKGSSLTSLTHAMLEGLEGAVRLAQAVDAAGTEIGLPHVAATDDIGSPEPMAGLDGRPLAETVFTWIDPNLKYWEDRGFALRVSCITAARACSEPFFFKEGKFATWRPNAALDAINRESESADYGVSCAIGAPVYLPGGVIGEVLWASEAPDIDIETIFDRHAARLQILALKFIATYADAVSHAPAAPVQLTRREIQCLKWTAAGKTDAEVSIIMGISTPTVRFHLKNAAEKLGVTSRSQAIHKATRLGYIGAGPRSRR